jgi:hypothetical protein
MSGIGGNVSKQTEREFCMLKKTARNIFKKKVSSYGFGEKNGDGNACMKAQNCEDLLFFFLGA